MNRSLRTDLSNAHCEQTIEERISGRGGLEVRVTPTATLLRFFLCVHMLCLPDLMLCVALLAIDANIDAGIPAGDRGSHEPELRRSEQGGA